MGVRFGVSSLAVAILVEAVGSSLVAEDRVEDIAAPVETVGKQVADILDTPVGVGRNPVAMQAVVRRVVEVEQALCSQAAADIELLLGHFPSISWPAAGHCTN